MPFPRAIGGGTQRHIGLQDAGYIVEQREGGECHESREDAHEAEAASSIHAWTSQSQGYTRSGLPSPRPRKDTGAWVWSYTDPVRKEVGSHDAHAVSTVENGRAPCTFSGDTSFAPGWYA
ncbi:hypothetical protein [Gemmatimonas sp.]|uniref:hypothetical protein n=1 Tax=Gemmatimonas sp. TaxID=1962908 RepID=UPI00286DE392|nr:hypothetical protein [Gemmatimonas sp.]